MFSPRLPLPFDRAPQSPPQGPTRRQLLSGLGGLGGLLGLSGLGGPGQALAGSTTPLQQAVRQAANHAVAAGVVGATFGALTATQQGLASAGLQRTGDDAPLRPGNFMNFGSNGKAMTAMAIARLVEQQVLTWQTRIADALPDVARIARPDYADVTLLQLLNHRGGLAPFTDTGTQETRFFQHVLAAPDPLPTTLAGQRRYAARWLLRQAPAVRPGRYLYSNAGYMLAAAMAEARCGQPFEVLIQQQLAQPLGLHIDTTRWANRPATYPQGYEGWPGALTPPDTSNALEQTWSYALAPAGFYACTATSYATWLATVAAGLRGETTPLPPATLRRLRALAPNRYALGWQSLDLGGTRMLFHRGNAPGFMAETVLAQDGGWAVFAVSNTAFSNADGSSWVFDLLDGQLATVLPQVMG